MSLAHVVENSNPDGEIYPGWGKRITALFVMERFAPRLLETEVDIREPGEKLLLAYPGVDIVSSSRSLWLRDGSHHAFALARNENRPTLDFGVITLLNIGNPANAKVVGLHAAYRGGNSISYLAGGDLTVVTENGSTVHHPAPVPTNRPLSLVTYDSGYEDEAVAALARRLNGPDGRYRQRGNPLSTLISWLRAEEEVLLLRPGQHSVADLAPLLAVAAKMCATAHTLEAGGCCLTPWDKPLGFPSQNFVRPLLLVHAGLEDRLRHEVAAARSGT